MGICVEFPENDRAGWKNVLEKKKSYILNFKSWSTEYKSKEIFMEKEISAKVGIGH